MSINHTELPVFQIQEMEIDIRESLDELMDQGKAVRFAKRWNQNGRKHSPMATISDSPEFSLLRPIDGYGIADFVEGAFVRAVYNMRRSDTESGSEDVKIDSNPVFFGRTALNGMLDDDTEFWIHREDDGVVRARYSGMSNSYQSTTTVENYSSGIDALYALAQARLSGEPSKLTNS